LAEPLKPSEGRLSYVRKDLVLVSTFFFLLLVIIGPLLVIGFDPAAMRDVSGRGSAIRQISYVLVAGLLLYALKPHENYRRILAIPLPLAIGVGYCWLSLLWAIDPVIALRRLALTTLTMWTLFAAMRQLKFDETTKILRIAMVIVLLANYVAVLVFPELGLHNGAGSDEYSLMGDWRGVLQHKNIAGAACALTMILFTFDRGRMPRWIQIPVFLASAYFLYQSNSKTSFGLGIASLVTGFVFLRYKLRYKGLVIAVLGLAAVAVTVLAGMYQNPLIDKLNDPKAFTGRTQIWQAEFKFIQDNPLLGSGYGSFWDIGAKSPVFKYASGELALIPSGHNGYLDLLVQLGIPGFLLILTVAVILPFRKLISSPMLVGAKGALLVALFLFCIGHNFTESSLFERDMLVWVMLMVTMALSQPDLINYRRAKFDVHELFRIGRGPEGERSSGSGGGRRRRRRSTT